MAGGVNPHKGEIALALDLANLVAVTTKLQRGAANFLVGLASRPLESVGPCGVAQPVADEISITSVDQDRNLVENVGDKSVERLHPIAREEEVSVDVRVATIIAVDLRSQSLHDFWLVQVLVDPSKLGVAQIPILARHTHIVWVLASLLVRRKNGVVAVDGCRNTGPNTAAIITALNQRQAARQGVVHGLASALVHDGWPATISTRHGSVIFILGKTVGKSIANHDGFEIDIGLLMPLYFSSEYWNVMSSVRFACNVEILMGILWKLLEEQGQESIDVLACSDCVADRASAVREPSVDRLIEEDDGRIRIPGVRVVHELDLLVHGSWTKLEEKTRERTAAWSAIEPEDDRVFRRVVAGLEEPYFLELAYARTIKDSSAFFL